MRFSFFRKAKPDLVNLQRINLCSGPVKLPDYCNVDIAPDADITIDLEKEFPDIPDNSVERLLCISAINYFSRERGAAIIRDVHRVLVPGGITRFATQDLRTIARRYVERDEAFFFQKLPNGKERFPGATFCDKFNAWFYGHHTDGGKHCKYFYDYEALSLLFREAGFSIVEEKQYRESRIPNIEEIDNRPEQMFFLEAVK